MADQREPAREPGDLARYFVERANQGDIDGLVALYEPDAVMALPDGGKAVGHQAIHDFLTKALADRPALEPGNPRPTLRTGDLALTSTRLATDDVTAEIARRQPDGNWLWAIDQPKVR
ncbi:nuclear transport factor 2 family protein [Nocardia sp. XZ_19_385]|uniref:YybH family protein n=1 Tax=Nocardia sp. XZ_19_385 TaxID=2769488 RepID=UPI00188E89BB|nr:nuclear transport factor 2 family protein [Nocardia sp. XZ_19_385]